MTKPEAEVASPCINVCTLDAADVCLGCGRLRNEIAAWPLASSAARLRIVEAARRRLELIAAQTAARNAT